MKRYHLLVILASVLLSILPFSSATPNLEIDKRDHGSVIVAELSNPAVYDFIIDNKGAHDTFEIYSLLSVSITPKHRFELPPGKTLIEVRATPDENIRQENSGFYKFEYQIRGIKSGIFRDKLSVKILPINEVLEIYTKPIHPDDKEAVITIKNKENTHLENMLIEFNSPFFSETKKVTLLPFDDFDISLPLKDLGEGVSAGPYISTIKISMREQTAELKTTVEYLEKEVISQKEFSEGLIFKKTTLEKTNSGNIATPATIELKKDIVSRLFTINNPTPKTVEREGLAVTYSWQELLNPNESMTVKSTTNYITPFFILISIFFVVFLTKIYTRKALAIKKRVSLVKTKGGEFALKVNLHTKARKNIDNVKIIDSLPAIAKLYEEYGKQPDNVDPKTKRMFWNVAELNKGEERVFSYIMYSKLNVTGRFELSPALAIFQQKGKSKEILSNRAFYMSEKSD